MKRLCQHDLNDFVNREPAFEQKTPFPGNKDRLVQFVVSVKVWNPGKKQGLVKRGLAVEFAENCKKQTIDHDHPNREIVWEMLHEMEKPLKCQMRLIPH